VVDKIPKALRESMEIKNTNPLYCNSCHLVEVVPKVGEVPVLKFDPITPFKQTRQRTTKTPPAPPPFMSGPSTTRS
jgi:hypothetical protein